MGTHVSNLVGWLSGFWGAFSRLLSVRRATPFVIDSGSLLPFWWCRETSKIFVQPTRPKYLFWTGWSGHVSGTLHYPGRFIFPFQPSFGTKVLGKWVSNSTISFRSRSISISVSMISLSLNCAFLLTFLSILIWVLMSQCDSLDHAHILSSLWLKLFSLAGFGITNLPIKQDKF